MILPAKASYRPSDNKTFEISVGTIIEHDGQHRQVNPFYHDYFSNLKEPHVYFNKMNSEDVSENIQFDTGFKTSMLLLQTSLPQCQLRQVGLTV